MTDGEIEEEMEDDPFMVGVSYFVYTLSIFSFFMAIWSVTPWFPWG